MALLGLLSNASDVRTESIDESVRNTGAFYDSERRLITLIDSGAALDSPGIQYTLAHELVHALQDQTSGLYQLGERTGATDTVLAHGCLVEGRRGAVRRLAFDRLKA